MGAVITKVTSFFTSIILCICSFLNVPWFAMGQKIDTDKFTLTFSDEFDGELDRSVWSGHYQYGNTSEARKGSYWNQYLAHTDNGNLVIPVTYLEDGMGGEGAGWYSAGIDTDSDAPNGFSQKYGYFECRCILPDCADIICSECESQCFNCADDSKFCITCGRCGECNGETACPGCTETCGECSTNDERHV